jgi:chemotaxis protein methyltransferase CheR
LVEKLEPVAQERRCDSYLDLYYMLKYERNGTADWSRISDALCVQETYFWREFSQIDTLVKILVPKWFEHGARQLRIWSAACATGEEPFTIAMALAEAGWGDHSIQIEASDASPATIEKARAGVYRERSFRAIPPALRKKYFTAEGSEWRLNQDIIQRVTFHRANLLAPEQIATLATAPVVFCRNCFIYFSPHAIRQAVASFAMRMPRDGYLFVGAAESLLRLTADFELREIGDAFAYVRT